MSLKQRFEKNNQQKGENRFWEKIFAKFDSDREDSAASAVALLSNVKKLNFETNDQVQRWFKAAHRELFPFHHLIPLEKISSGLHFIDANKIAFPNSNNKTADRLQDLWQSLAITGVSAKEATLLDYSLGSFCFKQVDEQQIEVDWNVDFYSILGGCAEIYRAEMLFFKRHIYEAGENLRSEVEWTSEELLPYLPPQTTYSLVTDDIYDLVMDGLSSPFMLTVSGINENNLPAQKGKKASKQIYRGINYEKKINTYRTYGARRINSWSRRGGDEIVNEEIRADNDDFDTTKNSEDTGNNESCCYIYRAALGDYWLDWQRAARIAKLDFDFLETLTDVRAIRFYELSKLWRAASIDSSEDLLPLKLTISYDELINLMPLPKLGSIKEIEHQIRALVKPLKVSRYIKSFTVEADWRNIENREAYIVFRFGEQ